MRYKYVIAGGTLDYLHKGHRALLDRAFSAGERIYIGITTDEFAKQKVVSRQPSAVRQKISAINNQQLTTSNYHKREREGRAYLKEKGWIDRVEMVPISDRFGTTLVDEKLEAIVVSPETELVATEINLLRAQKNWPALEIIVVPWVLAEDEKPINSVRIRNGEIDREGRLFALPKEWGVRKLPEELRKKLKKPLGRLVQ